MQIKFGTDGWRGIIDQDFTSENVEKISQAAAIYLNQQPNPSVIIGYDTRKKADEFAKLCASIMAGNNIKVYLVNYPCPTPAAGFSIIDKKTQGGIMFTASHNPAEFLGFKYMTQKAETAPSDVTNQFQKNLEAIKEPASIKKIDFDQAVRESKIEIFDPAPNYQKQIAGIIDLEAIKNYGLKILFNPMYGAGVNYLTNILSGGKTQITQINGECRADFGGKSPEPIVEKNISDQVEKMRAGGFDVGIAFDGDADRIGLIDEQGNFISSLKTFYLASYYFWVIKKDTRPIIRTQTNTVVVDHLAKKLEREVFEVNVGFKFCAEKMRQAGAVFAGEESGGSGFASHIPARDACVYALYILELMVEMKKSLSEIIKIAETEAGGGYEFLRLDVKKPYEGYDELKTKVTEELTKNPPAEVAGKKVIKTRTIDGLKFYFDDDSWLLIRFSGTEPKLRIYAEAKTMDEVHQLLAAGQKLTE